MKPKIKYCPDCYEPVKYFPVNDFYNCKKCHETMDERATLSEKQLSNRLNEIRGEQFERIRDQGS